MAIRSSTATRLGAALLVAAGAAASAQTAPSPEDQSAKATELRSVEERLKASEDQRHRIEADVEAIKVDHARLEAALIETTAKVQDTESRRAAANARLAELNASADALAGSLE